jgi:hypothetical protein
MDLGLKELDDEQLLELLGQCCAELVARDPVIRNVGQATIFDEAEKLRIMKEQAKAAVLEARGQYIQALKGDVEQELRRALAAGEVQLLTPAEEGDQIALAEMETRVRALDEKIATLKEEDDPEAEFRLRYANGYVEIDNRLEGSQRHRMRAPVDVPEIRELVRSIIRRCFRQPSGNAGPPRDLPFDPFQW